MAIERRTMLGLLGLAAAGAALGATPPGPGVGAPALPVPPPPGAAGSIWDVLRKRRSVRGYATGATGEIGLNAVSGLLFAAQGITSPRGFRAAPSAGALYPLEVFLAAGRVSGLSPGVYRYRPDGHTIDAVAQGDRRREIAEAALGQTCLATAPAVIALCAVYARVSGKYGARGVPYAHMEAGCAAQNIALAGVALGIGSVVVGAFDDARLQQALGAAQDEMPVILMPVGLLPG